MQNGMKRRSGRNRKAYVTLRKVYKKKDKIITVRTREWLGSANYETQGEAHETLSGTSKLLLGIFVFLKLKACL